MAFQNRDDMLRNKLKFFISLLTICYGCFTAVGHCADSDQVPTTTESPSTPETESEEVSSSSESTVSYENAFFKMLVALIALIIFVFLTFWMFRRMSHGRLRAGNSNRTIKIIDKRALSAKSILYLIEVENKRVLIAESQLEVRPISNVENPIQND
jgi:flagellar biogenesis protein FliO